MTEIPQRSRFWLGFAALTLAVLLFQGTRALWSPDEGRYANVAVQALQSGNWWVPKVSEEALHLTKPPMTYWAIAASMQLFGINQWAVRLPHALAMLVTVLLLWRIAVRVQPAAALMPVTIYASAGLSFLASNVITTDVILTFWATLACLATLELYSTPNRRWLWALVGALGLGAALLTKGPPALLSPLALGLGLLLFAPRQPGFARWLLVAAMLGLLLGLSWYASMVQRFPGLLAFWLDREVIARIASAEHQRNAEWYAAFSVYLPTLCLGFLPWSAVLLMRRLAPVEPAPMAIPVRVLWLWFGLPLGVFMLSASRLPLYLLPLFVPAALLMSNAIRQRLTPRAFFRLGAASLAVLVGIKAFAAFYPRDAQDDQQLATHLRAALPGEPFEVLFYRMPPRYGLSVYLDVQVERVNDLSFGRFEKVTESLREELAFQEGCRWLITQDDRWSEELALLVPSTPVRIGKLLAAPAQADSCTDDPLRVALETVPAIDEG